MGRPGNYHSSGIAVNNVDVRQPILLDIYSGGAHTIGPILVLVVLSVTHLLPPKTDREVNQFADIGSKAYVESLVVEAEDAARRQKHIMQNYYKSLIGWSSYNDVSNARACNATSTEDNKVAR